MFISFVDLKDWWNQNNYVIGIDVGYNITYTRTDDQK